MRKLQLVAVAIMGAVAPGAFGAPILLVVPNGQTSVPGNDSSGSLVGPFDGEFQTVYGRGQFNGVGGSLLITQFAYRLKPGTGSSNVTATSVSVYMSTSPYAPNTSGTNTLITPTFATNRGPDNTLVFSRSLGTLLSSPGCTGVATCPFDIVFTLTTPFLYDPNKGFLLIDTFVTGFNGSGTGEFDVVSYTGIGGPVAGVVSDVAGSLTGGVELSGNVTQLGYTLVVPEPGTWVLMLIGLGALLRSRNCCN